MIWFRLAGYEFEPNRKIKNTHRTNTKNAYLVHESVYFPKRESASNLRIVRLSSRVVSPWSYVRLRRVCELKQSIPKFIGAPRFRFRDYVLCNEYSLELQFESFIRIIFLQLIESSLERYLFQRNDLRFLHDQMYFVGAQHTKPVTRTVKYEHSLSIHYKMNKD